jgi:hypothetical protein
MSTVYAPQSDFTGTVAGVAFTNGQATVTDAWLLAKFAEWGFGIGSAASAPVPNTVPGTASKDFGLETVVGSLIVQTGLRNVEAVVATIGEDAAAGIADVTAEIRNQATYPGQIILKVWHGAATPIASTETVTVSWIAYGT